MFEIDRLGVPDLLKRQCRRVRLEVLLKEWLLSGFHPVQRPDHIIIARLPRTADHRIGSIIYCGNLNCAADAMLKKSQNDCLGKKLHRLAYRTKAKTTKESSQLGAASK